MRGDSRWGWPGISLINATKMSREKVREGIKWQMHKAKQWAMLLLDCFMELGVILKRGLRKGLREGIRGGTNGIKTLWHKRNKLTLKEKTMIFLILLCLVFFIICAITLGNEVDEMTRGEKIVVVTDYSDNDYIVSGDTIMGFQYELVMEMAKFYDIEIEWKLENSFDRQLEMLDRGEADIIACPIPITTELREKIDFSEAMLNTHKILVQRKAEYNDSIQPIRDQLELAGKTIYMPKNSPDILRLNNLATEIADTIKIMEVENYASEQLMIMVAKKDIDYTVCDERVAKKAQRQLPEIDIKTAVGFQQIHGWGLRKGDEEMKAKVDSFLNVYIKSPSYRKLYLKYY